MSVRKRKTRRGVIPILPYEWGERDSNRYPFPMPGREGGAVGSASPGGQRRYVNRPKKV